MKLEVNNVEYEIGYALEDGELVVYVDDEPYVVTLANEAHDNLGRFASKAGSAVKSVAAKAGQAAKSNLPKVTKGVAGAAVGGAVGGAIGGGLKSFFGKPDEKQAQQTVLYRTKVGMVKGAIRGAKKGAVKKLVANSLGIASERAGKYGWAVQSVGGLAVAMAGKKKSFGLEPGDFNAIGKELLAGGFSAFVSATLEAQPVYLEEGNFKEGMGQLAMMIADFLENSEEDYLGVEDEPGLSELGFQEDEGVWYIHRDDAEDLLGSLLAYGETKLEVYEEESVKLFNPFHDSLGRFASAKGIASTANVVRTVAGLSGWGASLIVDREAAKRYKARYGSTTFAEAWNGVGAKRAKAIKAEMANEKVFSKKIAGKEVSVTYGQLNSYGKKARFVSLGAGLVGFGATAYQYREAYKRAWEEGKRRADSSYKAQGKKSYSWPKGATDEDFQKMYRKVARKHHPDVGGDTETMQKINQAYSNKDWGTINDYFVKLEATSELSFTDGMLSLLHEILEDFLASDAELLTFPDDGTDNFVVDKESGLAVIDRITAQFLYDLGEPNEQPTDSNTPVEAD